ncbi:uncharacterized protein LOC125224979 [Leguminivora glycinivorella]|uniref:uncharacterized protein LOC125224979 n=1 Tax=Leguminivora glycinivorella TaxID=1035111 RepID=UPI00200BE5DF|nr:uncharacterized protein LOC125224979 [Leguminivora glycinivorella]
MFFVFYFLVFAYFTHSEINCFTHRSIKSTNYVEEHEEISNSKVAAQLEGTIHKTSNLHNDLKSNFFDKLLSDEMLLLAEHRHDQRDSSKTPLTHSSKSHLITPAPEIKQKWPILKHINNVRNVDIIDQNKLISIETKNNDESDEYLDPSAISDKALLKLNANQLAEYNRPNRNKAGLKKEINKSSKSIPINSKVNGMRSLSDPGVKEKRKCKTNPSSPCKCAGASNNKKRCTHATPNAKAHECSRYGTAPVTNHSCSQSQPLPDFITSNPYSFYPFYLPYTYFASEAPLVPYTISYPQPIFSDLKIPRKYKHKCRKLTTRTDDDLYYEDNSRERRPYDDNEYYHDSKKDPTKGIVYDVNQDALIKEIVKDLKIHNDKDFIKECYCDSSVSSCRYNIFILTLIISLLKLLSTMSLCFGLE